MSTKDTGTINWQLIRTKVPQTVSPLIDELELLCTQNPGDPARAIELKLQARLSQLRLEFEQLQAKEKA